VSRFWDHAAEIFETARRTPRDEGHDEMAVVLDGAGGLRLVMASGWTAEGLRAEYGGAVYHVTRTARDVCVEGRTAGMSCTLRGPAARVALPAAIPVYAVAGRRLLA
jgi:hypothetical protein